MITEMIVCQGLCSVEIIYFCDTVSELLDMATNCGHAAWYRGADNSLAPPRRKQATATEDFDVHISYLLS